MDYFLAQSRDKIGSTKNKETEMLFVVVNAGNAFKVNQPLMLNKASTITVFVDLCVECDI